MNSPPAPSLQSKEGVVPCQFNNTTPLPTPPLIRRSISGFTLDQIRLTIRCISVIHAQFFLVCQVIEYSRGEVFCAGCFAEQTFIDFKLLDFKGLKRNDMITVKEETTDLALRKDDLLRLSGYHNKSCISIYIPTHRIGVETLNGQDSLNLKNQLKQIRNKLSLHGMNSREIEKLLNPVMGLVNDADFWRHQSDGLAVFVSENIFEKYTVPVKFEEFYYLSSEFYLKQLFPLFNNNGHFFLLTLKKDGVRLYEGNKYGLVEADIEGLVPSRLEDSVGYDYEQKQLQFRTQLGGNKPGSFHGHGESESRDKNELLVFFREVDKGIMSKLHDKQDSPLVLCCLDYMFPVYKEACTHKNLFPQFISNNPADLDNRSLHERAMGDT